MIDNKPIPGMDADPANRASRDGSSMTAIVSIGARVFFVLCIGVVSVAAMFGAPHILYSYHVSHFALLYVLTVATLAAFPEWGVLKAFWRLLGFVTVLGLARVIVRHHVETNFLDWIADVSGVLGGLAPAVVQRLREVQSTSR